jgi:anti-anti-sigma factor
MGELVEVLKADLFGATVLKVTGDVDHGSALTLEEYVQASLGANGSHLLVDLAECPYMDSGGVSVLLYAVREVRGKGWIGVIAPSGNLLRLFEITGLTGDPSFRAFANSDEATAALERDTTDA